jgi:hypothetical protein
VGHFLLPILFSLTTKQEIKALVPPSLAEKPSFPEFIKKGVKILIADISSPINELMPLLMEFDCLLVHLRHDVVGANGY